MSFPALTDRELHVWWAELDLGDERFGRVWESLSAAERAHVDRLLRPDRERKRVAVRRWILRSLIGGYLGAPAGEVPLETGPHGKPFCPAFPELAFSHATSNGMSLYAFARDCRLGADLEVRPSGVWEEIPARRFLSDAERDAVAKMPTELGRRHSLRAWAAKEAIAKAIGVGLSLPLTGIELWGEPSSPAVRLTGPWSAYRSPDWRVRLLEDDGRQVAAVAMDRDCERISSRRWPADAAPDSRYAARAAAPSR